jgi:hypothetical protein
MPTPLIAGHLGIAQAVYKITTVHYFVNGKKTHLSARLFVSLNKVMAINRGTMVDGTSCGTSKSQCLS